MSIEGLVLQEAAPSDLAPVRALLTRADLPLSGIEEAEYLLVARVHGAVQGCAALELRGPHALLRSVAVAEPVRGSAVGTALVERALEEARLRGIEGVYLLTTTARPFFERLGFVVVPRGSAPPTIAGTTEFRDLCPASATLMKRDSAPRSRG